MIQLASIGYLLDPKQCQQLLYVNLAVTRRGPQCYVKWNHF